MASQADDVWCWYQLLLNSTAQHGTGESPLPLVLTKAMDGKGLSRGWQSFVRAQGGVRASLVSPTRLGTPRTATPARRRGWNQWQMPAKKLCTKAGPALHLQTAFTLPPGKLLLGWCPGYRGERDTHEQRGSISRTAAAQQSAHIFLPQRIFSFLCLKCWVVMNSKDRLSVIIFKLLMVLLDPFTFTLGFC